MIDAFTRQLCDKTLDTLITLLSQRCQISEEELYTYPVGTIIEMCHNYEIIDDVNNKLSR